MSNVSWLCKNGVLNETLTTLLEKCKSMTELKQIHSILITLGLSQEDPLLSGVLSFTALSSAGDVGYSRRVLMQLSSSRTWHWNTVIRGHSKGKNPNRCLSLFVEMLRRGVLPGHMTFPFLAKAVARLEELEHGESIHAHIAKSGFESDRFIVNSLIHMYASCGDIVSARKAFDGMTNRNSVSWNSMLDGYAKCGDVDSARALFDSMPERDVVSWSSLIDGYVKSGEHREAMALFDRMRYIGPMANEVTMVSVLCACAHLGALEKGKMMHRYLVENKLPTTLMLQTSLLDMYAKCGAIDEALAVFDTVPVNKTDVLIWNAIIGGLATHGFAEDALRLFDEMQRTRIKPDEITYLCLLSACAHGGLVCEAWHFFECLDKRGMAPKEEHYACMVDVLARAGRLEEAYRFVGQIPTDQTASMLGALLNGCVNHRRLDIAEIIGRKLIELDPDHDGRYIGLSNIYAVVKRWDDAKVMRAAMEQRGVKKSPGLSFVEIAGTVHRFVARDKTHPSSEEIYVMLNLIVNQVRPEADHEDEECYLYNLEDA
ncbi:pentatricopeptide repeat-containing protein At5g08305 isoform X1 [Syzygium oleosum]|uniref:pentatricopeptide repeat-containing protein At5g08305 isoform X1 n=2 Tax=Syzygium oleosum TaxID=219896 RepID=UPI0011D1B7CF|nr:pentatricopeptide repeat-containing protein At5g08305 isoform X1 [Syzygium oleosum]